MDGRRFALLALVVVACWVFASRGGAQLPPAPRAADGDHFVFDVVESFDAKYAGDTPGHVGRQGGLEDHAPRIALGDPVYRGFAEAEQVGVVTNLRWSRGQGSLEIEFDPLQKLRIEVGERVWVRFGGAKAAP